MSDAAQIALITGGVTLLIALGGGLKWAIDKAMNTWDTALGKRDSTIEDLRKIREDTLAQGVGEAKSASREAVGLAGEARDIARDNQRMLRELLDEWRGRS